MNERQTTEPNLKEARAFFVRVLEAIKAPKQFSEEVRYHSSGYPVSKREIQYTLEGVQIYLQLLEKEAREKRWFGKSKLKAIHAISKLLEDETKHEVLLNPKELDFFMRRLTWVSRPVINRFPTSDGALRYQPLEHYGADLVAKRATKKRGTVIQKARSYISGLYGGNNRTRG